MKFGGTSVADSSAFESVVKIVRTQADSGNQVVVVVSAMSGVTNALASCAHDQSHSQILNEVFARHLEVARHFLSAERLNVYLATLSQSRAELDDLLDSTPNLALLDRLLSFGEQLSAQLLTLVLSERNLPADYVDARRCVVTDNIHGGASPLMEETTRNTRSEIGPLIEVGSIPVLGGFIGAAIDGSPTTLGRNGSDYTASIVGVALAASEIQIWTDVSGVLTADPRVVANALPIEQLSYSEAIELSYYGAKVVFPKAIQCAAKQNISLRICNSFAPQETTTIISSDSSSTSGVFKSIARKVGLALVRVRSYDSLLKKQHLNKLFDSFANQDGDLDLVDMSEQSISVVLHLDRAQQMIEALREIGSVEVVRNRALVTMVGEGLCDYPGSAHHLFEALNDIRLDLISHGRCTSSLVLLVAEDESERVVRRLHKFFLETVEPAYLEFDEAQLVVAQSLTAGAELDKGQRPDA